MHSQTFKSTYITVQKFGVSKICFKEINTFMRWKLWCIEFKV